MGRMPKNLSAPAMKQIWENVRTKTTLLILRFDEHEGENVAHCAVLNNDGTCSQLRVLVPLPKFKFYSNRGLALVGVRAGKLPKAGDEPGLYNTRLKNLGAR